MQTTATKKEAAVAEQQIAAIQDVAELAFVVFKDREIARRWLMEPNLTTDNRPPQDLLSTDEGKNRVRTILQRIEFGVLA